MRSILAPPILLALGLVLGNAIPAEGRNGLERETDYDVDLDLDLDLDPGRERGSDWWDWPWEDEDECEVSKLWCKRIVIVYNAYCVENEFGFCGTLFWIYDKYCYNEYKIAKLTDAGAAKVYQNADPDPVFRALAEPVDLARLYELDRGSERNGLFDKREASGLVRRQDDCEFPERRCKKIKRYRKIFCEDFVDRAMCKFFKYFERNYCFPW